MKKTSGKTAARRSQKSRTSLIWIIVAALVVMVLLYMEQIALLYVLATVSVAALLTVVALSDLRGARETVPDDASTPPATVPEDAKARVARRV